MVWIDESIDFTGFVDVLRINFKNRRDGFYNIIMGFLGEFGNVLFFQVIEVVLGWILMILKCMKIGEMLDFTGFYRTDYRTNFGDFRKFQCIKKNGFDFGF